MRNCGPGSGPLLGGPERARLAPAAGPRRGLGMPAMRKLALCVIGLGLLGGPGCSLARTAARVVCSKVGQTLDDCAERRRNRKWAEDAWGEVLQATPGYPYTDDYARGFKEGFAHYLYQGGTGEPPP